MSRKDYDKAMYDILEDNSKFKKLKKVTTILKKGQLQHFISTLNKGIFGEIIYEDIFPAGSQASRSYVTPKLHKSLTSIPPLRPIV